MSRSRPRSIVEKIWDDHVVVPETAEQPAVLAIDLHLVHEVTSPQAFSELARRGLAVRRPDRTLATLDHATPTVPVSRATIRVIDAAAAAQIETLERNCRAFGVPLLDLDSARRGIVHVIGPELGLTQPGMTVVCGDSHTSTHGAFGALAFGIGTSEVTQVLATQALHQRRPRVMQVRFEGRPARGVTAKDLILALLAHIGARGATGHVIEYTGEAVRAMDMEARMTVCNMSIEAGARAGLMAPDDTTFEYLADRPAAPAGAAWEQAVQRWRTLPSDDETAWGVCTTIDAGAVAPMVTWGTNPGMGVPVDGRVPEPRSLADGGEREAVERALRYMDFRPGQPLAGTPVHAVFIGSCTNARLSDLRAAAALVRGRRFATGVRVLVVPGSQQVKRQAEAEGLDQVFRAAGAEWREPGCSMCIAMNGDRLEPGQYAVSTSNRNFEGRQGPGGRTLLASPLTAAASGLAGVIADPRPLVG
ncbi:MAG: 3-isopropylmalate dehydratase large subunit [Gemmatimonadetes bacterium]|nr:3-isopropylmalate dehydratase large subunit [Gemmatimonadota bacterium]